MSELILLDRFQWMARIRAFEQACLEGVRTREIHGELHLAIGQEAIAAGMVGWMRDDDALVSTHRNHSHALVKGVSPYALLAEIFERSTGLCGGFGGHMHPFDVRHRFSASGIVGASLPVALGHAYSNRLSESDAVAIAVTGEGGANHGTFHECMVMASAWKLPLMIVIENNGFAISVKTQEFATADVLAHRASAYGCAGAVVDGTDVDAVSRTFSALISQTRSEMMPTVLVASCRRFQGHYEGDVQAYRPQEGDISAFDPLVRTRRDLMSTGVPVEDLDRIEKDAGVEMQGLLARVRSDPLPNSVDALRNVFAEGGEG